MSGRANVQPPPAPAEPGNTRALTHGATSEQALAPRREQHAVELRRDYPHLDDRRLAILADRLARFEVAHAWLDQQDGLVRNRAGEPWPLLDRIEKWGSRIEAIVAGLEAERREQESPRDLATAIAEAEAA